MADRMEKFRELNENELHIQEHELGEQIFRLRFQLTTGQAESVKKLRQAKRDLARVKTLVRQKELGQPIAVPKAREKSEKGPEKKPTIKRPTHKRSSRGKKAE
ncbi:MAG: 50S ribosomal protein L29 [Candidatus Acidiferrales bacterium]